MYCTACAYSRMAALPQVAPCPWVLPPIFSSALLRLLLAAGMALQQAAAAVLPAHGAYTFSERTTTVITLPVLMRRILNFSTYELVLFLTSQLLLYR